MRAVLRTATVNGITELPTIIIIYGTDEEVIRPKNAATIRLEQ